MKTVACLLLLLAIALNCGCYSSLEAGNAANESSPTADSPYHEVSFSLDPFQLCLSDFCYDSERVTIHLEEDQRLELWWYAYGDTPEVYATLIMPDGTRCTGRQIHPGGGPIESYPCNPQRWGFDADPGSTGELGFRCSSTYGATTGGSYTCRAIIPLSSRSAEAPTLELMFIPAARSICSLSIKSAELMS